MRPLRRPLTLSLAVALLLVFTPATYSAPNGDIVSVKAQIEKLQEDAASAGEAAMSAKLELSRLQKQLAAVQQDAANQGKSLEATKKSLATIAIARYKSTGLGEGLELLFSTDPTLYLTAAGSLDNVTRKQAKQLRAYATAKQRLDATSLTVSDKVKLVQAAEARYRRQAAQVQEKLDQAQALLDKLEKADRERLLKLQEMDDAQRQAYSLEQAKLANAISGRAGTALRFAVQQIGDRYVWGAAGPIKWDCSGLTMRAFQSAGVDLPHSSRAQFGYGRSISLSNLQPGDLVFFGKPISHVAIYLGQGKMVHAPRPGSRVQIAEFPMSLGEKKFVGARRL